MIAFRSVPSTPSRFIKKIHLTKMDKVLAPNLHVLAAAAYRLLECGGIAKSSPKTKVYVAYELYPPENVKNERWFCHFIKNIDDKTFLGRWCMANSSSVKDGRYAKPVVFEWRTVKCRTH